MGPIATWDLAAVPLQFEGCVSFGPMCRIGGRGPVVVGSPSEIAEELIAWVEETDVDGFNLAYAVTPETFLDFVELVVPELQSRGRYKLEYAPGTLREKLYGTGRARLGTDHPAARFRGVANQPSSR